MNRAVALALAATTAIGVSLVVSTAPADAAAATPAGGYVPVSPVRVVNTATGAYGNHKGPIGAHKHIAVTVDGKDEVPSDAAAVVVSLAVSGATKAGDVVASSPDARSMPAAATVSFAAHHDATDLAIVPVVHGRILIWNGSAGHVQLTADVSGYYTSGSATAGGAFRVHGVSAARVVDTRRGTDGNRKGAVAAGATVSPHVTGLAGVPADARAVAATVTVIGASRSGTVSVRTSGGDSVPASIQVQAHRQVSQLLVLPLSRASNGEVAIGNHTGKPVHLAVDVSGYYVGGAPASASVTQAVEASTVAMQSVRGNSTTHVTVAGRGGVPRSGAVAAVVTLRVVKAAAGGTLSASSGAAPDVVAFDRGTTRSGVVIAPVDRSGRITVTNHSSRTNRVQVDVDGYVTGTAVPAASTPSVAHYLAALTGRQSHDVAAMRRYADADEKAGARFVLFDVGAQSVTGKLAKHPGVSLANAPRRVRITYPQLVADVHAYIAEYAGVAGHPGVRIAVGTNNDGEFDPKSPNYYAPKPRGQAWAKQVIVPLRHGLPSGVTVIAADDIEYVFSSTEPQALAWENSYLSAIGSGGVQLIYNGDANSCSRTPGVTGKGCTGGWTQADYYALAYNHGHVQVLPQVFFPYEGAKWANIDRTGSGSSRGGLTYVGALTDHSRAAAHLTAPDARATLYRALSSALKAPALAAAVDFS